MSKHPPTVAVKRSVVVDLHCGVTMHVPSGEAPTLAIHMAEKADLLSRILNCSLNGLTFELSEQDNAILAWAISHVAQVQRGLTSASYEAHCDAVIAAREA
jgi:hypothetical protein